MALSSQRGTLGQFQGSQFALGQQAGHAGILCILPGAAVAADDALSPLHKPLELADAVVAILGQAGEGDGSSGEGGALGGGHCGHGRFRCG